MDQATERLWPSVRPEYSSRKVSSPSQHATVAVMGDPMAVEVDFWRWWQGPPRPEAQRTMTPVAGVDSAVEYVGSMHEAGRTGEAQLLLVFDISVKRSSRGKGVGSRRLPCPSCPSSSEMAMEFWLVCGRGARRGTDCRKRE